MKVSGRLVPSEGVRKNLFCASPSASGASPAIMGVPWLVEASPQSLPYLPMALFLFASVCKFPLFYKDTGHIGSGVHSSPV